MHKRFFSTKIYFGYIRPAVFVLMPLNQILLDVPVLPKKLRKGFNNILKLQSNLCVTTTLGSQNLWPLLTGGRCSEVALCYEN